MPAFPRRAYTHELRTAQEGVFKGRSDIYIYILEFVQRLLFGAKMLNAKLQVAVTIGSIELISSDARVFSRACVWLLNHAGIKAHWTRNLH